MVDSAAGDGSDRTPAMPDLLLSDVPAVAGVLTEIRTRLTAWATAAGLGVDLVSDVALAVYEAMANVVDHAYNHPGGTFDLHACRVDDLITVTVSDHGQWQPPSGTNGLWRGRGLLIIERAAHQFELSPHTGGTTVRMRWTVHTGASSPR